MLNQITNYDGSITTSPQQLIYPKTVEEIQAVMRDSVRYPSPVRAMGSYHSLTPCASSDGTILNMSQMAQIIEIDAEGYSFTAQAGLEIIEASKSLRAQDLQFMLNIEIGNMTLGAAACCHSKDALDGINYGQVSSYVNGMKWVTPSGELAEASEESNLALLQKMRSSYGLCGVVYEVRFKIKPIEAIHFNYEPHSVDQLTAQQVDDLLDNSEGLICWTVGRTAVFQRRQRIAEPGILRALVAAARHRLWNFGAAHVGHFIDQFIMNPQLRDDLKQGTFNLDKLLFGTLHLVGGISMLAPDKTIDYRQTPASAKYAFTFWAFPRAKWLETLRAYLDFADEYFKATGFRCNMPLGAYHIRLDKSSILSYTYDQEIFSIDPIHAVTDQSAWDNFLVAFNDFASRRNGLPLLNQSPFVTRAQAQAAYGQRWEDFSQWVASTDPAARMQNAYFAALLSGEKPVLKLAS